MANKNTDPIEMLADSICNALVSASTRAGKETAPNDKTYATVICGVNQKFIDDVSSDDKNSVIDKYSIPESVDDGENDYYTFKINGAYYCKQQNGDFKLYDQIMVYIPNGDWSNMYFDYPDASSHGGSGSSNEHQLIVSVEAPGGAEPKLGDMWLFVNDETKTTFEELTPDDYINMYTWQEERTGIKSWQIAKCTIGGSTPPSFEQVGDLWIQLDNENIYFSKIYMCTAIQGLTIIWSEVYPDDETGEGYNLYISADRPLAEGDYWIRIDDEVTQNIVSFSEYKFDETNNQYEWKILYNAAGGSVTIGNGLEYDGQGRLQVKLGEGLRFDSNGAIEMAYNPVVNIAHALVYKKET